MARVVEVGEFKVIEVGYPFIVISHLYAAQDTIVLCEASDGSIRGLQSIFDLFELASGLKVNYHKSCFVLF
jgi:hypothetical protein